MTFHVELKDQGFTNPKPESLLQFIQIGPGHTVFLKKDKNMYFYATYLDRGERTYPISYAHTYVVHTFIALSWCGLQLNLALCCTVVPND